MFTVTAAIIERNGEYLISRRRQDDSMGGYWEFPGGGVDEGETPDACITREIREELGIVGKPVSLFDAVVCGDGKLVVLFYLCQIEGEPQALDCDELRWVRGSRLSDFQLLPADIGVAARLAERQQS